MSQLTASDAILNQLAAEHRRVLSDWRALILLRRATFATAPQHRRWNQLPDSWSEIRRVLRRMESRGDISPIPGLGRIFKVNTAYAQSSPLSEDEILMEAHPSAALCCLSALVFHGLTMTLPKGMTALAPTRPPSSMIPLGTTMEDWRGLPSAPMTKVGNILGSPVRWTTVSPTHFFGIGQYQPHGYPVLVTTPERTLLDATQKPDLSGGISNVLDAWLLARDTINVNDLVDLTDQFGIGVLRQRVGFILEELGIDHPVLEKWQQGAKRGGSSKLVAADPYSSTYSERWSLSLNAPIDIMRG